MNELIVTAILHGLVFTTSIGHIDDKICAGDARALSGPNWVVSCKTKLAGNAAGVTFDTTGTSASTSITTIGPSIGSNVLDPYMTCWTIGDGNLRCPEVRAPR